MAETTPQPVASKPHRRWFQFSLRTLMLVMVVLSVGLGFVGRKFQQVRERRQAVEAIQELGGSVDYTYPASIFGGGSSDAPPGPAWLTEMLGDDFWGNVDWVEIRQHVNLIGAFNDAGLEHLKGFDQLKLLDLGHTQITDAGLERLKGLTQLGVLNLKGTQITDAGLERLKGLNQLESLDLRGTQITGAGLEHFKGLTQLDLCATSVTDAGVENLKGLNRLRVLSLERMDITDAGLEHLKALKLLDLLLLSDTQITDAGLEHLKGFAQLTTLDLRNTEVTDGGVKKLQTALPNTRIVH